MNIPRNGFHALLATLILLCSASSVLGNVTDSDGDGVNDYREQKDGTNPNNSASFDSLSKGLLVYYPFLGNTKDESGRGNDLTLAGANLTLSKDGFANSAIQVGVNNGAASEGNVGIIGNTDFTMSFWMKPTSHPVFPQAIVLGLGTPGSGSLTHFYYRPYHGDANLFMDGNYVGAQVMSNPSNLNNIWSHIAVGYNSSNRTFSFYLDGVLQTNKYQSYAMEFHNLIDSKLLVAPGIGGLTGILDDIRIYNRTLSTAEVSQLYANERKGNIINYQNSIYTIVDGTSWTEAEANAVKLGGHLVAINSNGENDFLWREFSNATKYQIRPNAPESPGIFSHWIGLTDMEQEGNWKWSNGDPMAFVNPPFTIQEGTYRTDENWVRVTWNVPSSWTGGIETKGFWQDHNVDAYQNGYETPRGIAEIPFVRFRDSAYVVVQGPTWEEAEANANKLGGHLVTINDVEEWNWFKAQFSPQNGYAYTESYSHYPQGEVQMWVGLNDAESEGVYEWVSGEPSTVVFSDLVRSSGDDYGVWQWEQGKLTFYTNAAPGEWAGFKKNIRGVAEIKLGNMVPVQGGTLPQGSGLAGQVVGDFQIGKYEVTWAEWKTVRDWAVANGYTDLANAGVGSGDDHPVRNVNWHDVVKWCNAKSEREGLLPVYKVNGATYKTGQSVPTVEIAANGYRLPLEKEWEWAARGGVRSQGYIYSGGNEAGAVAWNYNNSSGAALNIDGAGRGTWPVGQKAENELGLCDMSGNVWEWCWDNSGSNRRFRGGSWAYDTGVSAMVYRGHSDSPALGNNDLGFRLARNADGPADITAPEITSAAEAYGIVGEEFSYQIAADNNPTSFGAKNLPAGLNLNSTTGAITGRPTRVGSTNATISATNSAGTTNASLRIQVVAAAPVITGSTSVSGTVGAPFTYQITASNSPTSYGAIGLPGGLKLNNKTGLITGTPTSSGLFSVALTASNSGGTGRANITIRVTVARPTITGDRFVSGRAGSPFRYQIKATNNPRTFGASGLPNGLRVNSKTGLISGTPRASGVSNVTISATNAAGTGKANLSIRVLAPRR